VMIMLFVGMMGVGMGFSITPFLIAVQSAVRKQEMGTATSTLQFSRSLGGAIGVSVMGAVLSLSLSANLSASGLHPDAVALGNLLNPIGQAATGAATAMDAALRPALAGAIQNVFVVAFVAALLGLIVTSFAPRGRVAQLVEERSGGDAPEETARGSQPVAK
jgi:hypothetical protein